MSQLGTEQTGYFLGRGRDFLYHEQASEFCEVMVLRLTDIDHQISA